MYIYICITTNSKQPHYAFWASCCLSCVGRSTYSAPLLVKSSSAAVHKAHVAFWSIPYKGLQSMVSMHILCDDFEALGGQTNVKQI